MSVNNITNENNKKLFESRLQMKQNSNSINKISFEKKSNNNINVSFLSSSQPFTKVIFHKKRKIQSILENSLINNINNNSSINKKIIKIKKNRNKKKKISLKINTSHNKSNILIKDITFFRLKDSFYISDRRNRTILSVNKRMTQQNSINKSMGRKSRKKNLKFKLKSHFKNSRNSSSIRNNSHYQDSFLIQKIKKIKYKKRPNINSISMTNNSSIMEHSSNRRGRNTRNNNNKNGLDISIGQILHTQRNLFADKNIKKIYKNTFGEIKYKNNKLSNNNSMLKKQNHTINYDDNKAKANKSKKKFNNSSINSSNLSNKFLLKNKEKKMSRNYKNNINKKHTFNIFNKKGDTLEFKALNIQKKNYENKKFKKLNKNNKINHQNILRNNNNKNLEKKQRIIEDNNNGTSTKTNDEFFSEEKEKKINESSIEEDSGILSMDEIEDIIKYNNMENINKDDNYLFKFEDHSNFIKTYKKKIINLFFDDKNHLDENYKQNKIKMKKKILEINSSINNGYHRNNFKDLKVFTYNNTSKIKKNC